MEIDLGQTRIMKVVMNKMKPLYNIKKSFQENFKTNAQLVDKIPEYTRPPKNKWLSLFDYKIASPLGIPACPLMTSKGITLLSKLGFDVFTYKTVRNTPFESYPLPNICYVSCNEQLGYKDIGKKIVQKAVQAQKQSKISISNSFGNASFEWSVMQKDIEKARNATTEGQLLIVSVFGVEQKQRSIIDDFAYTAQLGQEAGAQCIELNVSCPNLKTCIPMHHEADLVYEICKKTKESISIPFTIKVGVFEKPEQIKKTLMAAAKGGARGICGINSIPMHVVTKKNNPYFGNNRIISGVSGNPIRMLALDFVKKVHKVVAQEKLDLAILGTGGITLPNHFDDFLNAGATIAMSATGVMWNAYLAYEYHTNHRSFYHDRQSAESQCL